MNRQRGFAIAGLLPLLPYLLGAVAVIGAATMAYQFVDNRWATDAGIAEGRKRASAELKPQLDACQNALATQERAVQALKAEGEARVAKATKGLQEAKKQAAGAESEAARLRKLAAGGKGGEASACPAGDALREVRQGLAGTHK